MRLSIWPSNASPALFGSLEQSVGVKEQPVTRRKRNLNVRIPFAGTEPEENAVVLKPVHRSEEHTSELQSLTNLVCRLLLEKKKTSRHSREHRQRRDRTDAPDA